MKEKHYIYAEVTLAYFISIPVINTFFYFSHSVLETKKQADMVPCTQRRRVNWNEEKQLYSYWWWRPIDLE